METEALKTAHQLMNCLSSSSFRLTKWGSNSKYVIKSLPSSELSKTIVDLDLDNLPIKRALGIMWNSNTDKLKVKSVNKEIPYTKRGILSLVSSVFDPLGIVTPAMLELKLIIQELWRCHLAWDAALPSDLLTRWERWKHSLSHLSCIEILHWYGYNYSDINRLELHIFSDASDKAYGAVAYVKSIAYSKIKTSFILAKSRLAPLKGLLTIPKLELQAAVTVVRMKNTILEQISIPENNVYLWSDSKTILKYVRNENRRFPVYVMHRVNEIRLNSCVSNWKFVPGSLNPADDCTRYIDLMNLSSRACWFNGPEYLHKIDFDYESFEKTYEEESTSEEFSHSNNSNAAELEKVSGDNSSIMNHINRNLFKIQSKGIINWETFSSYKRLVRTIAWIIKFKRDCIQKRQNDSHLERLVQLTAKDLEESDIALCKLAQHESYQFKCQPKFIDLDPKLIPMRPVLIDGVLQVGGRLKNANIPMGSKHQIILPQRHHLSKLIVSHYHSTNMHAGTVHTLSLSRQRYWIIGGKVLVRRVLRECLLCERRRVLPISPIMADLPPKWLATGHLPFTYTGVDYFGPMIVKLSKSTRSNKRTSKRYGVLFTCLTIRATHLEIANNLSTDSFIMALRRFRARCGDPKLIWSDNGTNFIGAESELAEAVKSLNQQSINDHLSQFNITWKFNPPSSPWMGGSWEILVKIVKRALKTVVTDCLFTEEALYTFFVKWSQW